ncbi:MAG: peptide chain release factor N(5)-glutamine methyltransferase [Bacteroidetes bacterium]|nr:peptide chain release factor N(5)-glutamine methyltransferase [Bacteroidota bacterium]MDA1119191.1 peptide chain release factor N(5)-glutamine methyltransferase [Bacteroidota bacterium]
MILKPKIIEARIISETEGIYDKAESRSIAGLILEEVFNLDQNSIFLNRAFDGDDYREIRLNEIVERLKRNEPIQHILGFGWFMGRKFNVSRDALIPRQETEELVDLILSENPEKRLRILDIGTGSGCIAICLALVLTDAEVHASDISSSALEIAKQNAKLNDIDLHFHQGDIFLSFPDIEAPDIIICNPPYIGNSEKADIHRNVLDYEPDLALFVNDNDPLIFYRKVIGWAEVKLNKGGRIYFEINESKGEDVNKLFNRNLFNEIRVVKDINNKDRVIRATKV